MADKSSTGAVHLTSLDLDVSTIYEQLNSIDERIRQSAETARNVRFSPGANDTQGADPFAGTRNSITTTISAIESLNLQYKNFQNTLAKSKLDDAAGTPLANIRAEAERLAADMVTLTRTVKDSGTVTKEQSQAYKDLASKLKDLKGQLKDAETNAIKTGQGFKDLGSKAENAGGAIATFLTRLSDKVKWMAAYRLIMLVQNAILGIVDTIKTTEDAVVELQRVLNENISNITISDELNNIAYEFGRSFEDVAEVAVKFAQTGKSWNEVIDATRATMLGLNTAELSVSTATEGLIAVMSQFGVKATDLSTVIDKINITADNFPVTSEKIVAALQRAGGTAASFNMTLEETIATITTLAEKTGKSGESIGTGLNSLIIFTSKADNLKAFAGLSKEMEEVVKSYKSGATSIIEVWKRLSVEIERLSEQQKDALFNATNFDEFADQFEAEATEYAAGIKAIYSSAGAYRQNLLTVLLNDASKIDEVLENMLDAEGYSLAENAKYMKTLTANVEQLKIAWGELAVQLGNSGLMDVLKFVVQLSTSILKLTKELGGLSSLIILFSTALLQVKLSGQELPALLTKIGTAGKSAFNFITAPIQGAITAIKLFVTEVNNGKTKMEAFQAVFATFNVGTFVTALGAVFFALNLALTKMREYRQEQKQLREETIARGNEAKAVADDIYKLYSNFKLAEEAYNTGVGSQRAYEDATNSLRAALSEQGLDVQNLTTDYENLTEAMKEASIATLEEAFAKQTEQIVAAKGEIEDFLSDGEMKHWFAPKGEDMEQAIAKYEEYVKLLKDIRAEGQAAGKSMEEIVNDKTYKSITEVVYQFKPFIEQLKEAEKQAEEKKQQLDNLRNGIVETGEEATEAGEALADIDEKYLKQLDKSIKGLGDSFDSLSKKIDSFQKAYYETLPKILDSFNKTGKLTVDQLQTLLEMEPEYLGLIEEKNGKLTISKEKTEELVKINNDYLMQMAATKLAEEAETVVKEVATLVTDGFTEAQIRAKLASQELTTGIQNAALAMLKGEDDGSRFRAELEAIAKQAGLTANEIGIVTDRVNTLSNSFVSGIGAFFKNIFDTSKTTLSQYKPTAKSTKKSSSSGKSAAEKALDAEKKAVSELTKRYKDEIYFMEKSGAKAEEIAEKYKEMQTAVHNQANKYRKMGYDENNDFVRELGKAWWEYADEIEKLLDGIYDASVDAYKNAIESLEHDYEHLSDSLDYTGMSENLKKQVEYQVKIQEAANKEFERLLAKGVDVNDDAVQSVVKTWRDACNKINDLNEQLAQSILDTYDDLISLADAFDVWDRIDTSKVELLEKELKEINSLYKEGSISLAKYKELLESVGKTYLDARVEALEKQQDDIEQSYKDAIQGYKDQIDAIKKQKDASDKYYDGLIDQLRDVEESNERINAQLDYYAERQKILRNLEQAQARSGVEWREKEIEYQEQLAELDKDWNRQQQEWSIADQITALEKLKKEAQDNFEAAIERLQDYINAAEKESEEAVKSIADEIDSLKEKIYRAITEELATAKKNAAELKQSMKGIADDAKPSIENLSKYLEDKMNSSINSVSSNLVKQITAAGENASKALADSFTKNFVNPVSSQVSSLMKSATSSNAVSKATNSSISSKTTAKSPATAYASSLADDNSLANQIRKDNAARAKTNTSASSGTNNTVNLYADFGSGSATGALNSLMNKMQDFFTQPFKR